MKNRFKIYLSLSVLYALFIFFLSSRSNIGDPKEIFVFLEIFKNIIGDFKHSEFRFLLYPLYVVYLQPDKIAHMILYAGFGSILYLTLSNSPNPDINKHPYILAIIVGSIYGASDEFHQFFVPGRSMSIWDLAADATGLMIAQGFILIFFYMNSRISTE